MFNGRNILSGFPEELNKVVNFLNEKADKGEFVFSDSFEEWANKEEIRITCIITWNQLY